MPFLCCAVNAVNTLCFFKEEFPFRNPQTIFASVHTASRESLCSPLPKPPKTRLYKVFFPATSNCFWKLKKKNKNSLNLSMHVSKPMIWKILKIYKCLTKNDAKPRSNSLRNDECVCFYLSSEGIWAARAAHSRDWDLSWEPIRPSTWKACRQKHEHNRDPLRACSSSAFLPFLVIFFSRFAMFSSPLINDSAVVIADPESRHSHFVIVGTLIRYVLSKVLYFTLINHIVFSPSFLTSFTLQETFLIFLCLQISVQRCQKLPGIYLFI